MATWDHVISDFERLAASGAELEAEFFPYADAEAHVRDLEARVVYIQGQLVPVRDRLLARLMDGTSQDVRDDARVAARAARFLAGYQETIDMLPHMNPNGEWRLLTVPGVDRDARSVRAFQEIAASAATLAGYVGPLDRDPRVAFWLATIRREDERFAESNEGRPDANGHNSLERVIAGSLQLAKDYRSGLVVEPSAPIVQSECVPSVSIESDEVLFERRPAVTNATIDWRQRRVNDCREQRGVGAVQFAKSVDVHDSTIRAMAREDRDVKPYTLKSLLKLLRALNVSLVDWYAPR
jgi:hypothetical protein